MKLKIPTLQELENYVKVNNLTVDPEFFLTYFTEGDWIDSLNHPVRSWKQKLWTWHRKNLENGAPHKCSYGSCKKPGVYIAGKDRDGHPYYRCIDHKPQPKPLPAHLVPKLKTVPEHNVNINNERNRLTAALEGK